MFISLSYGLTVHGHASVRYSFTFNYTYAIRRAYPVNPGVDDSLEPALGLRLSRAWGGGRGAAIFYLALGLAACELALHARGAYRTYYGISRSLGRLVGSL